jgi:hypothetical protein
MFEGDFNTSNFVPVPNLAKHYGDIGRNGRTVSSILNLGSRWR